MDHNEQATLEDLFEALLLLKNRDEVFRFMKDLCTPQEIQSFVERWRVCQLLDQGKLSYRQIHEVTGTSLATIGRVARSLRHESNRGYEIALTRIRMNKK